MLLDCEDFLWQKGLKLWGKEQSKAKTIRQLVYSKDRFYRTYKTYIEVEDPETAANTLACLVHQTNYLLDQQLRQLEERFLKEGGFTERLYQKRREAH